MRVQGKSGKFMRYGEIRNSLSLAGIEDADSEARILIENFSSVPFDFDTDYKEETLKNAVAKRCERYPLQYIIGKWWFARCEFFVDENCLVPRPDTETVVELARRLLPPNAHFADLCTGSGCIAVSLLDLRTDIHADAVELYPKTLAIARKNADHNGVGERFCDILGNVFDRDLLGNNLYDAIISNPPYIRSDEIGNLQKEVLCEPLAALDGGADGLVFYRAIIDNFEKNLTKSGLFIFEIGYDQGDEIRMLACQRGFDCTVYKDLSGCERAAVLVRSRT